MNSPSSRQTYGVLPLSPTLVHDLQLAFSFVEAPKPRARFLNFPLADDGVASAATGGTLRPTHRIPREVAA